jgi:hypothetical protein
LLALVAERKAMGKLIEFYIPANFKKAPSALTPSQARGKVLAWKGAAVKKSA